jgi:hypothetical protein
MLGQLLPPIREVIPTAESSASQKGNQLQKQSHRENNKDFTEFNALMEQKSI